LQQLSQLPLLQQLPEPQSPSLQQVLALTQLPPQHREPSPHCASFVHPQAPHCPLATLQH
jgi:hypothetical protein